jgi:teichuronic acid exporter
LEEETLKNKAIKGVMWSFIDQAGTMGIGFIIGIILARLLSPSEYGLVGMIAVFTAIAMTMSDSGFGSALIRKPDLKEEDLYTAFWYNLSVSALMYTILFFSAPYIAEFYHQPKLTSITRVTCLSLLFEAFLLIPDIHFTRNINFKITTRVSYVCSITSGIVGILMAVCGCGVWSLVAQGLVSTALKAVLYAYYCHWKPLPVFSKESFLYLWGFGNKLLAASMLTAVYKNIYQIVIGKFYSAADLGQYTRAASYNGIFSNTLTSVVQRVSFPTLSSIQGDKVLLREGYRHVIKSTMLVSFAGCLTLAAMAKPLIVLMIGEKWMPCVEYMQIICFSAMLYPLHAINLNVLQVIGRSDLCLRLIVLEKIIGVLPIVIGIFWGIKVMLWGSVVTSIIAYFLKSYYSARFVNYSTWQQIKDILPTFVVSFISSIIIWSIALLPLHLLVIFLIQCVLAIGLYIGCYEKMQLPEYVELKGIALNLFEKIKHRKNG